MDERRKKWKSVRMDLDLRGFALDYLQAPGEATRWKGNSNPFTSHRIMITREKIFLRKEMLGLDYSSELFSF